jgi:hypothetical protein
VRNVSERRDGLGTEPLEIECQRAVDAHLKHAQSVT